MAKDWKKNRREKRKAAEQTGGNGDDTPVTDFEQRTPRSLLTPEIADRVEELAKKGLHKYRIAAALGISRFTLCGWIRNGRENPEEYPDCAALIQRLKRAEAAKIEKNITNIQVAGDTGSWQASAWILERQHPEEFASDRRIIALLEKKVTELEKMLEKKESDVGN